MQFKFNLIISMIITTITLSYCFHEIKEGYFLISFDAIVSLINPLIISIVGSISFFNKQRIGIYLFSIRMFLFCIKFSVVIFQLTSKLVVDYQLFIKFNIFHFLLLYFDFSPSLAKIFNGIFSVGGL